MTLLGEDDDVTVDAVRFAVLRRESLTGDRLVAVGAGEAGVVIQVTLERHPARRHRLQ